MKVYFYIMFVCLAACQYIEQYDENGDNLNHSDPTKNFEEGTQGVEFNSEFSDVLPPSLWSPAKRKVNAHYYFLAAEYEMLDQKSASAQKLYDLAYNLDPDYYVGKKLVAATAQSGQFDAALIQAKKLTLLHPKNPQIRNIYGRLLLETKFAESAEKEFSRALELDPNSIESHLGLISVLKHKGNYLEAIHINRMLLERHPSYSDGWSLLAKLQISGSDRSSAIIASERATRLNQSSIEYKILHSLALQLAGQTPEAISTLNALAMADESAEKMYQLFTTLYAQLDSQDAILDDLAQQSPHNDPTSSLLQLHPAFLHLRRGDFSQAVAIFESIHNQLPQLGTITYFLALVHEGTGKTSEAIELYKKIPSDSNSHIQATLRLVKLLRSQGMVKSAFDIVRAVLLQKPHESAELYIAGAQILGDEGKYVDVIKIIEIGIQNFPHHVFMHYLLGVYQERAGRIEDAIHTMKNVINMDPNHHAALNFLGYLYADLNINLDEAQKLVLRALEIKPKEGSYLDSLGWIYFRKGDLKNAELVLQQAHAIEPQEGIILEHLGDVALERGQMKQAKDYFSKALKCKLEDRDSKRIQKKHQDIDED